MRGVPVRSTKLNDRPILMHRMLRPESHPVEAKRHCPHILETWLRHSPQSVPASRDYEDWAENACMLHALSKHGRVEMAPPSSHGMVSGDKTPLIASNADEPDTVMWGSFNTFDSMDRRFPANLLWNNADCVRRVQDHFLSPAFLEAAGRMVHICDADRGQVVKALESLHDHGLRHGFIKTRAKGATHSFAMGEDRARLFRDMDPNDDWGLSIVHREGAPKAFVVQQGMEPRNEYRMIVVGRKTVSGAGCIERHVPCDNEGDPFDSRMEIVRGDGRTIRDVELTGRYAAFAESFAERWADENGDDVAYALDLCVDALDDRIKAIEMNPMMNVGLYANDADRIVGAMVGRDIWK